MSQKRRWQSVLSPYGPEGLTRSSSSRRIPARCRDCKLAGVVSGWEFERAASPRCVACGGVMEPKEPLKNPSKNRRGKDRKIKGLRASRFGYPVVMAGPDVALHGDRTPLDWGPKCRKPGSMHLAAFILAHYGIVTKQAPQLGLVAAFADLAIPKFKRDFWHYSRHQAEQWVAKYRERKPQAVEK